MPVFNSYVNKEGYYITARPSDVGNITYQITPGAGEFIAGLGYKDEDTLPWGLINPLRSAGLVYTNGEGVAGEFEEAPELDPTELDSLTADQAADLLEYLESREDVSGDIYNRLQDTISTLHVYKLPSEWRKRWSISSISPSRSRSGWSRTHENIL